MMSSIVLTRLRGLNKSKSYFYRILRMFLISQIPIIVISVGMYFYVRNSTMNDIVEYNHGVINSICTSIESSFSEIVQLSYSTVHNVDVIRNTNKYKNLSISDVSDLQTVTKYLSSIQSIKNNIDGLFIYSDQKELLLDNSGTYNCYSYFDKFYKYQLYSIDYWNDFIKNCDLNLCVLPTTELYTNSVGKLSYDSVKNVIPFVVSYKRIINLDAILVMNIDENYIHSIITSNKSTEHNEVVILNSNGSIVSRTGRVNMDQSSFAELKSIHEDDNKSNPGYRYVNLYGKKYAVFYKQTSFPDWTIFSLIPQSEFYGDANIVLRYLLLIDFMLILTCFTSAFVFSSRLFSPIHNLFKILYPAHNLNELSKNTSEIDLIKEKFRFLRSDNDNLNKNINEIAPLLREKFLQSFILYDNSFDNRELFLNLDKNDITDINRSYMLLAVVTLSYSRNYLNNMSDGEQCEIKTKVYDLIKSSIISRFTDTIFIKAGKDRFLLIVNSENKQMKHDFCGLVKDINSLLAYDTDCIKMIVAVGRVVDNLNLLPSVYKEISTSLEYLDLYSRECIFDIDSNSMITTLAPLIYSEEKVSNIILYGTAEKLKAVVDSIFKDNFSQCQPVLKVKRLLMMFSNTCEKLMLQYGIEIPLIEGFADAEDSIYFNIEETKQLSQQLMEKVRQSIQQGIPTKGNVLEKYIEQHYMDQELCLEKMASDLNISSNYLSRQFKEKVGQNFIDYLAAVRVEKAKVLLTNTCLSIEEICKKVGLSSRVTFNRMFNKIEGVSPNTYRNAEKPDNL